MFELKYKTRSYGLFPSLIVANSEGMFPFLPNSLFQPMNHQSFHMRPRRILTPVSLGIESSESSIENPLGNGIFAEVGKFHHAEIILTSGNT